MRMDEWRSVLLVATCRVETYTGMQAVLEDFQVIYVESLSVVLFSKGKDIKVHTANKEMPFEKYGSRSGSLKLHTLVQVEAL